MHTITKQFDFSASHQLLHLPENHQCHRLHGHNYKVIVELQSSILDSNGFVVDYGELKPLRDYIDSTLDHRHLNDILEMPTAENLAKYLFDWGKQRWEQVISISVSETDKTWAKYSEN